MTRKIDRVACRRGRARILRIRGAAMIRLPGGWILQPDRIDGSKIVSWELAQEYEITKGKRAGEIEKRGHRWFARIDRAIAYYGRVVNG